MAGIPNPLNVIAIALGLIIALMTVYYLVRVIGALRNVVANLDKAHELLVRAGTQTDPAPRLVGGIAGNVTTLSNAVNGVAKSLGLI